MTLLEALLGRYLYKEAVQELAREFGLPTTGTKDELIGELLASRYFNPNEALSFLDDDELRAFCEEQGLWSGGTIGELRAAVLEQIEQETNGSPILTKTARAKLDAKEAEDKLAPFHHAGPWSAAVGLDGGLLALLLYLLPPVIGLVYGVMISVVAFAGTLVALLLTSRRWVPLLARLVAQSR